MGTAHDKMSYEAPLQVEPMTFDQAMGALKGALRFGICPLLETVIDMLACLDNPDHHFDVVQIAGTNGKTSTSRYTAAILQGQGLSCALYTSPELVDYTERMEIDGTPVSHEAFAWGISVAVAAGAAVNAQRETAGERPYDITEFDLLTVAAMAIFAREGVDVAVLECGLGARWDATSATDPVATCVTGVGLDHTHVLGDTLEAIAAEKATVIAHGRACVLGVGCASPASVEDVFLGVAREQGVSPVLLRPVDVADAPGEMGEGELREHADLPHASYVVHHRPKALGDELVCDVTTPRTTYTNLAAAKPIYQAANIACATTLSEAYLGRELDVAALRKAVAACPTPGRFDVLSAPGAPLILIDAAHNPQSVRTFLAALDQIEPEVAARPALLCAVLADKDVHGIVALLARAFPRVYVCATPSPRAMPAIELADAFREQGVEPSGVFETVAQAVSALHSAAEPYVAVGSITLAGAVAGIQRRL